MAELFDSTLHGVALLETNREGHGEPRWQDRRVAKEGAMATGSGEIQAKWLYLAEL